MLDLRRALPDDEGDAVGVAPGRLGEVHAEQVQATLKLLVTALDSQQLQTLLMTGQVTLGTQSQKRDETSQAMRGRVT